MFRHSAFVSVVVALCLSRVQAYNTDDQVGQPVPYGSFNDPAAHLRPRFRYWIPDASVNLSVIADDFVKVKDAGMGGLELLGYYLYGDYPAVITEGGPTPTDWTKYGWGTQAWKELFSTALRAAKDNSMVVDFANGPNQGAGVPAKPDDEGIMYDLVPFNMSVPIGGSFDDTLPGWGSGDFVSASTGLVLESQNSSFSALPAWQGPVFYNGTTQTLAASSLQDVTDQVDDNGHLSVSFDSSTNGSHYRIFAYYQVHSQYREQASPLNVNTSVPQSPVTSFVQNGSWVVDHFSARGAKLITDFWENELLDDETRRLIQDVGNYAWEDSMEIGAGALVWYTPQLLQAFEQSRGYSLNQYLPLIFSYNTEANGPLASPDHFYTDDEDGGLAYVNDYRQTLTELNQIYLEALTDWATTSLQSQFSAQVGYNLPLDMLSLIPIVNAPETESLGFNHDIDAYRQFSGPANLAGKRVISSELGAQRDEVYSQTLPELIWDVKRSIVGGVNNFVYHGFPFSGNYPNTTWPGYTTFTYRFSNMHGPRQPSWEHYREFMDWTARTQWVAQSGVPKVDLAFWLKRAEWPEGLGYEVASVYEAEDLVEAGYSYNYLSPENLVRPEAYVQDGVLAPDRQAFKAMIVRANDTLTVSGVERLVDFANAGLSIIFSGGLPQDLLGHNASGTTYVRQALAELVGTQNVHIVPYDNLAVSLSNLDIAPRTKVSADRPLYTYWREDANASVSYAFVYNDGWDSEIGEGAATGSITFDTSGVPYSYDAWTGEVAPILAYQESQAGITIPMALAGNQSAIIAFHQNETAPSGTRLFSTPAEVYSAISSPSSSYNSGTITMKAGNATSPVLFSNGTSLTLPVPPAPYNLSAWNLTIESWTQPDDPKTDQTTSKKSNSTYTLQSLKPWNQISDSLRNVSGRGIYSTSFIWPPSNTTGADVDARGAMLDFGAIANTARVWANGQQLPPLDPTAARADIEMYLQEGKNDVMVVVTTTLGNALIPFTDEVRTSGTLWLGPEPTEQDYGLIFSVMVVPYAETVVEV